jgi:lysozyme
MIAWRLGTRSAREPAPGAPPTCAPPSAARGIDVSYYQPVVAWRRLRAAGIEFAFIRVSDGATIADPKFSQHWVGARRAGLLRGAYQFFRPEESSIAQADVLIAALRRDPGELPPVIDVEVTGGATPEQLVARVRAWLDRVRAELGVEPIIYTGPELWRDGAGGADLTSQPLWLAHYTAGCPTVPPAWTHWTFWQYTDRGTIDGIDGPVDLNLFAGDSEALAELARRARRPLTAP